MKIMCEYQKGGGASWLVQIPKFAQKIILKAPLKALGILRSNGVLTYCFDITSNESGVINKIC